MAIEKIIEKIISESKSKAKSIIDQAESKAQKLVEDARLRLGEEMDRRIKRSFEDIENEKQRKIALAKLESRKIILQTRCDILEGCFNQALKEMMDLEGKTLEKLVANILQGYVPVKSCEIIVKEGEKDKFAQILSSLWGDSFGKYCFIRADSNFSGSGFILRTKRVEFDFTFERIMDSIRPTIEQEVIRILFTQ